jgi:putative aminopeptidase FrvX
MDFDWKRGPIVNHRILILFLIGAWLGFARPANAQFAVGPDRVYEIPAVTGYEQSLAAEIRNQLKEFSPKTDNLGNVYVTVGGGAPHRLIVTPMDEPGYVVSDITTDGYLRVQRLPQAAPNAVFDLLHAAQPVWIMTRDGKKVSGVFAGLSIHLEPARQNLPKMSHPDEMYVDIGATSAEEVRSAGVDVLDPIALARKHQPIGNSGVAGPAVGDRFGCEALLELLSHIHESKIAGTTTIAFAAQQWTGGRGLDRLLNELQPDEVIYVGRLTPSRNPDGKSSPSQTNSNQAGILLAIGETEKSPAGFPAELVALAAKGNLPITSASAARPRISGYAKSSAFPERFAQLGVPTRWPVTPAEFVAYRDLGNLESLLESYLQIPKPTGGTGGGAFSGGGHTFALQNLVQAYGPSGHEEQVREQVKVWLPHGAKTETDSAGNLILHLGDAKPDAKTPRIVFVAHMDEIGYQVRSVELDGRLLVDPIGGGYTEYFQGHLVRINTDKYPVAGVLELPDGWDKPGFEWPRGPRALDEPVHVYVGTHSSDETQKLGIKVGDWMTIPKEYRPLLGTRANARSFDDRVGCAALLQAVNALTLNLPGRDVTFVWSTGEEIGLKGAAAYAERAAKENNGPDFVFGIDTFVSSDSPLETKRFADAYIGSGFVIRAVDNSNIAPREYVDRVIKLARDNNIPVQYGVTGGGNDGAVFVRYGAVDIPLGWPLRYAHSPAEVVDTRDVDALAKIITVIAKNW